MRIPFEGKDAPMIVNVIRERTPREVVAKMRNGELDGCRGYDIHIDCLLEKYRNEDCFKYIADNAKRPTLALHYKSNYDRSGSDKVWEEDERLELLRLSVKSGLSAVDMQGYSFDPESQSRFEEEFATSDMAFAAAKPKEISLKPEIIKKQMEYIDDIHKIGGQVLMSCHTGVRMTCDQIVSLALEIQRRGADIVKMVTPAQNDDDVIECIKANVMLGKTLKIPYQYHVSGDAGRKSRMIVPMFGSYMMFCTDTYSISSDYEQLHLKTMTDFYSKI